MLFTADQHQGLRDGTITVALRCWKRPTVRPGGTLRSPGGVLRIDAVEVVDPADVTEADARAAGAPDLATLLERLACGPGRTLHRIRFHRQGEDPRAALRAEDDLDPGTRAELADTLATWDARSRSGPWTRSTLTAIAEHPGVVSTALAEGLGVERMAFKRRVRRLKDLGLTESLEVGYRLSPRGRALVSPPWPGPAGP